MPANPNIGFDTSRRAVVRRLSGFVVDALWFALLLAAIAIIGAATI